jgi:lipopolysaccharide export system permease protein
MKLLYKMSMGYFFRYLISSILFFVLILELLDIFSNLWRYINNGVALRQILQVALLYLPKCIVFSLPISVLFSVAYTLGNLYANNELIAVFGCGVSLYKFVFPFILIGVLLSTGSFLFEEKVVIRTYREKGELTYNLLNQQRDYNNTNVTIIDNIHNRIYHADYYNDTEHILSNVVITENDGSNWPRRLDANIGEWNDDNGCWIFHNVVMFRWDPDKNLYAMTQQKMLEDKSYDQSPDSFRNISRNVEEMEMNTAKAWIETLRKAGLPYKEALTEYYKRFSFTFTPLIVALISISFTGKFRKNVLLMSLLSSMMIAAGYYILQMVLMLFAKMGYIPPLVGAWGALFTFIILSLIMLKNADT